MTKMIVVSVLVTVVILTECLLAYFMIPSTAEVETWAKGGHGDTASDEGHGGHGGHGGNAASAGHSGHGEAEVDLGKYNVVVHEPASQITLRVNFHLIGTVPEEEHTEFEHLLEKHKHRLRDHTIFEIRNSKIEDLTDPGLALLKRRILAKSNDLLGKPMLHEVVFSDFSFVEQ
jgi:flagellar FliL protein